MVVVLRWYLLALRKAFNSFHARSPHLSALVECKTLTVSPSSHPRSGCQGDGAEEPGQSRGGGQRVVRNARPVLPTPPDARRGYQRPGDGQAEPGGHLEVPTPASRTCRTVFVVVYVIPHTSSPVFPPSPFDKDDQTSSTSTVSKRLLSNQSPPDTPSMREQVFYVSLI